MFGSDGKYIYLTYMRILLLSFFVLLYNNIAIFINYLFVNYNASEYANFYIYVCIYWYIYK